MQYSLIKTQSAVPEKARIVLETDEVHIWHTWLDRTVPDFFNILSPDERDRAERYHFQKDKRDFIARRGILRQLLSCYLDIKPQQIQFAYNESGKPSLANEHETPNLFFNQSHSDGLAVYAFTHLGEIGVDVEQIHDIVDMIGIAKSYFSPGESTALRVLPRDQIKHGFFNCWTRKEAFIKAIGDGLNYPLDKIIVTPVEDNPGKILSYITAYANRSKWYIYDLDISTQYKAALTVNNPLKKLTFFNDEVIYSEVIY